LIKIKPTSVLASALAFSLLFSACARDQKLTQKAALSLKERVDSSERPDFARAEARADQIWKDVRRFYRSHGYAPAWIEGRRPGSEASELINAVHAARDEGLDPEDYDLKALEELRTEKSRNPFKKDALLPEQVAEADLRLTYMFIRYATHLLLGRVEPSDVDPHWFGRQRRVDVVDLLDRALDSGDVAEALRSVLPQHTQYVALKRELARSRETAERDASAADRVAQIELNLERWRWLPEELGERYAIVNIPTFQLQAVEQGKVTLAMKVVVGKADQTPTPIFSDEMTEVVFSPYWNVPTSILRKEIVPKVQSDPDYLTRNDLEVVKDGQVVPPSSVDWSEPDLRLQVRQRPGAKNSLGFVKFVFPNKFDVYLHDTPADGLFEQAERDFSHGCVRVEKPVELAQWVLRDQPEWTRPRIEAAMHAGREQHVALKRRIPVYIVYATAWVDEAGGGRLIFADDRYGHDRKHLALLGLDRPRSARAAPAS
jgi:murein L,D-transpeptidase YcbB/YkuD